MTKAKRRLLGALSLLAAALLSVGPASATHNIVDIMDTTRATSLSASAGVVTAVGAADTDIMGDEARTEWYLGVAAMEYVEENGGSSIVSKVTRLDPPLDDFNRANEDPLSGGGDWARAQTDTWFAARLVNNKATNSASGSSYSYWTQDTYAGGEGSVWGVWGNINQCGGNRAGVSLIKDVGGASSIDGYEFIRESVGGANNAYYRLTRMTNGVRTVIADSGQNPSYGGHVYLNLRRSGGTVEGWTSPDGLIWTNRLTATDSTHSTGTYYPGLHLYSCNVTMDDYGIGPPPGYLYEETNKAAQVTDTGETLTEEEAATIVAANAAAAEATVTELNYYEFFGGMVEMVVVPDHQSEFLSEWVDRLDTLTTGLAYEGKPLLVVVQDGSGNNLAMQGHVPLGDGTVSSPAQVGIAWQAPGVAAFDPHTEESFGSSNPPSPASVPSAASVYVSATDSGSPILSKGASARPEILSFSAPSGTTLFSGVRMEAIGDGDDQTAPTYGLVEIGWIKSNGQAGFSLGADGQVTSGPCISPTDAVEGILVGWTDTDTGLYECVYTPTPQGLTWGADNLMAVRNDIPDGGVCDLVQPCGWVFKLDGADFYPASPGNNGGIALSFDAAYPTLVTEYSGASSARPSIDVEFGDDGGAGSFYRGFVIQPGTDPSGADAQVDEGLVIASEPALESAAEFTYYSGTDRNYARVTLGAPPVDSERVVTNGTTATHNQALNLPDADAGDILVASVRYTAGVSTVTWPAGWNVMYTGSPDPADDTASFAWRQADGTEGSTITVVSTGTARRMAGVVIEVDGGSVPYFAQGNGTGSSQPNGPNLAPVAGAQNYLWLSIGGNEDARTITSVPSGFSNGVIQSVTGQTGGNTASAWSASRQLNASSLDPAAWSLNANTQWTTLTVGVPPA